MNRLFLDTRKPLATCSSANAVREMFFVRNPVVAQAWLAEGRS
jgi:hypothetical protein